MQRLRQWWAALTTLPQTRPVRQWGRWLALAALLFLILFGCGQVALWVSAPPAQGNTLSQLTANYGPWTIDVIQPVDPAILEDIQKDEDATPGDIPIVTAVFWPTATPTPTLRAGDPTLTPNRPPTTSVSDTPDGLTSPTPTPFIAIETATATRTPNRTATPTLTPTITRTPTQTLTRTRTATLTLTRTRTVTRTQTLSPTVTFPPPPTATRTVTPTATFPPPPTGTWTLTPTITSTPTQTVTPTNTPAIVQLTGRVFEDVNYAGGAGSAFGAGDAGLPNVRVDLYSGAILIATTTTDALGQYLFVNLSSTGTYVLRIVSASLGDADTPPTNGFNGGFSNAVAEQTYEHNGVFGNGSAGALGGNNPAISDFSTAAGAGVGDTNVPLTFSGADLAGVDVGFAYNLIVNTLDSGQGSLRQFISNANAVAGANTSQFNIPTSDPNFNTIVAGAFTVQPLSALPSLADSATALDGVTQEINQGDQRAGLPDIVIDGSLNPASIGIHLSASFSTVRKLDVRAFNGASGFGLVLDGTASGDSNLIADNYLTANSPGNGTVGAFHIYGAADNNLITGNTLTSNNGDGLEFDATANVSTGNQITNNTFTLTGEDGAVLRGALLTFTGNTVTLNGVGNPLGCGIEAFDLSASLIENNTASANGQRGGICLFANTTGNLIRNNTITGNEASGITLMPGAGTGNTLTQNSLFGNNTIGIDHNLDGVTLNDGGDGDAGPNNLLNFPVIYSATLDGFGNVILTGEARPGATIEFFIADGDPSGYGEGQTFLAAAVEGSASDTNPGAGTVDGTAAQFTFVLPAGSLTGGMWLTATATDVTGNTSEFGLNVTAL